MRRNQTPPRWYLLVTLLVLVIALACGGGKPASEPGIKDCFAGLDKFGDDRLEIYFLCNVYPKDAWTHATLGMEGEVLQELDNPGTKSTLVVDQFRFRFDPFEGGLPVEMVETGEFTFEVTVDMTLDGEKETFTAQKTQKARGQYYHVERALKKERREAESEARQKAPRLDCIGGGLCEIHNTDCTFGYTFDAAKRTFKWETHGTCSKIEVDGKVPDGKVQRCDDFPLHKMTVPEIFEKSSPKLDITMDGKSLTDKGAPGPIRYFDKRTEQATIRFPLSSCLYPAKKGRGVTYAGEPPKRGKNGMLIGSTTIGEVKTASDIDLLGYEGTKRRNIGCQYASTDGKKTASRTLSMTDRWAEVYDRRTGRLIKQKTWKAPQAKCQSTVRESSTGNVGAGFSTEVPVSEVDDFFESAL